MKKRTIGVLSKACSVKVTTIRYYERIGLLPEPDRTQSGQRVYDLAALDALNFIRHARELGFSINAIRELMSLDARPDGVCVDANRIAALQLDDVEAKLANLERLRSELLRMLSGCEGDTADACEVIKSLRDHERCDSEHVRSRPIVFG